MTYPPPAPGQPGAGPQGPYPPSPPPQASPPPPASPPPMPGGPGYGEPPMPVGPGYGDPPMPVGPGYGGSHKSGDGGTNGLAIAAFVTGLLGCLGILGLVLGLISLRQIGDRGGKGRGFAIAGIVLSCLWLVAGIAGFALRGAVSGSSSSSDDVGGSTGTSETQPKEVDAKKMKVGDCINDNQGATNTAPGQEPVVVESVKIVPCNGPHDGEVMAIFQLSNATMPNDQQMSALASAGCKTRMLNKLSRDPAAGSLATSYYYPTADSWRQGDRAVTCVAVAADQGTKLTRRLRT